MAYSVERLGLRIFSNDFSWFRRNFSNESWGFYRIFWNESLEVTVSQPCRQKSLFQCPCGNPYAK